MSKLNIVTRVALVLIAGAGCIMLAGPLFRSNKSLYAASKSTQKLLGEAGGTAVVCAEADQMFERFGVGRQVFFTPQMLKDYPAVNSLGNVDYIMPGDPSYIKIRVGSHLDGFMIKIIDGRSGKVPTDYTNLAEVVKNRVYVYK